VSAEEGRDSVLDVPKINKAKVNVRVLTGDMLETA
jgi:magnesium-transporting ATPase (P-type)